RRAELEPHRVQRAVHRVSPDGQLRGPPEARRACGVEGYRLATGVGGDGARDGEARAAVGGARPVILVEVAPQGGGVAAADSVHPTLDDVSTVLQGHRAELAVALGAGDCA